jgi:hypothetical protein
MNRTMTSPGSVVSPPLQLTQFCKALISSGKNHAAKDRGGKSGDLIDFSSTNGALLGSKGLTRALNAH